MARKTYHHLHILCDPEWFARLKALCDKLGFSVSDYVLTATGREMEKDERDADRPRVLKQAKGKK